MVYSGYTGGSGYHQHGGGADYLCLPEVAEYLRSGLPPNNHWAWLYGSEYQNPIAGFAQHDHNVPCSVCYVSRRAAQIMIPAKIKCPDTWIEEYKGFLMADKFDHRRNAKFVCVDENAQTIPGSGANTDGALMYHVVSDVNKGLPASYIKTKTIACVVCTK